jgi:diguanylate cyclase (GGDEF)-like protein
LGSAQPPTAHHEGKWNPWQVTGAIPASSPGTKQGDKSDPQSNSLPDNDQSSLLFRESSQVLTSLCGKLQVALHVDSDAEEYRKTIQQSFEQGERLAQLFRSFHEELETLRYNAGTDPLTGLKNRRTFEECLAREISRSVRYSTSFALLLLDLRKFKLTNDAYGHAVGDDILRAVAHACLESARASDVSCRIGGDEFAILLPQAELSSAKAFAERVARKFELYAKAITPNTPLGIDYGVAIFPEDGDVAMKLFQNADKKLYESKQGASRLIQNPLAASKGLGLAV